MEKFIRRLVHPRDKSFSKKFLQSDPESENRRRMARLSVGTWKDFVLEERSSIDHTVMIRIILEQTS